MAVNPAATNQILARLTAEAIHCADNRLASQDLAATISYLRALPALPE